MQMGVMRRWGAENGQCNSTTSHLEKGFITNVCHNARTHHQRDTNSHIWDNIGYKQKHFQHQRHCNGSFQAVEKIPLTHDRFTEVARCQQHVSKMSTSALKTSWCTTEVWGKIRITNIQKGPKRQPRRWHSLYKRDLGIWVDRKSQK